MDFLLPILPVLLISTFSLILPCWVYRRSKKEDAKHHYIERTRDPIREAELFFLALIATSAFFWIVTILLYIFEPNTPAYIWTIFILAMLFLVMIPLLLVLIHLCTYELILEDGMIIKRLTKTKRVPYSEMFSYHDLPNRLTVYDGQHQPLFVVEDHRAGMEMIMKQLDKMGISKE